MVEGEAALPRNCFQDPAPPSDDPLVHSTDIRHSLLKQLLIGRLFLLSFQFLINWIMVDYPTDAFKGVDSAVIATMEHDPATANAETSTNTSSLPSTWIQSVFDGLARWDAQHFIHIA